MTGSSDTSSLGIGAGMDRWRGIGYRRVLLFLVAVLAVGGGWAYWLWRSEPVHWQQRRLFFEQHTAQERMAMAESVEQRILAALSDVSIAAAVESKGDADKTDETDETVFLAVDQVHATGEIDEAVFLTIDEINAWIDQRLYDWAANQGSTIPDFIKNPMLAIIDGELVIAFLYDSPSMRQVFSVQCEVILEDGQAVVKVVNVSGGRLKIPAVQTVSEVVGAGQDQESEMAKMVAKITKAFDGMVFDPILKLGQQKVLLKAFELEPDGARLVFEPASEPTYAQDD